MKVIETYYAILKEFKLMLTKITSYKSKTGAEAKRNLGFFYSLFYNDDPPECADDCPEDPESIFFQNQQIMMF